MSRLFPQALWILLLALNRAGAEPVSEPAEVAEMAALMALLEEETDLATRTNMNADYVPGMVSVLHADDLKGMGLTTVADALGQVAGFYTTVNNVGDTLAIVRGAGATLNTSNLKILVDGAAVNRPVDASADWALRLPLSQVDRIEVVRGPGSALYGEFAFAGTVNIISRQGNTVGVRGGSYNYRQGYALFSRRFANGAGLQLNLSAWDRDNSGLHTNLDNFARGGHGYSPGEVYDHERGQLLLANLDYQGYQLQLQHAEHERGGWYGRTAVMPLDLDPRVETVTGLNLSKSWQINADLSLGASLDGLHTKLEDAAYLPLPAGVNPPGPALPSPVDRFRQDGSSDTTKRANFNLRWSGLKAHTVYLDAGYSHSRVDSAWVNFFTLGQPLIHGDADMTRVLAGTERSRYSLTLQDQWQLRDNLELTLGARRDHYDDWGSHTSPRIAAVWRAGEHHIFKTQYAEAFRPPTLTELYPGPNAFPGTVYTDLREERLKSVEAAYVYRLANRTLRVTAFHTEIEDLIEFFINPGDPPTWRNRGDIESRGVELEWQQRIGRRWEWFANLAYVKAEDPLDSDEKLLGAVDWLANMGLTWHSDSKTSHALRMRYVGEQEGWEIYTGVQHTQRYDPYSTFDYTFCLKGVLAVYGLDLLVGVKNLTDKEYDTPPTPAQYPQGLPHGRRTAWLQFEYSF
ncbi:MAG: TonB-dependent receptor [Exilibacterium sp.]